MLDSVGGHPAGAPVQVCKIRELGQAAGACSFCWGEGFPGADETICPDLCGSDFEDRAIIGRSRSWVVEDLGPEQFGDREGQLCGVSRDPEGEAESLCGRVR